MELFNWIGYIFGYVLFAAFSIFKNYGVAIILFTIFIKLIMFPLSIKQQKSMAKNARMSAKQQELKEKYGNDREKLNEEMNKLYSQEGMGNMGCLTMMVPMFLLMGVYYAVISPLTNTLHLAKESVTSAINNLTTLPGIGNEFSGIYGQIDIIGIARNEEGLAYLGKIFNQIELNSISEYSNGLNFLGFDLLGKPQDAFNGGQWYLILIPVLCFLTSFLSQLFTTKLQNNQAQQQGCMKAMFIIMPLFSAYIAYSVPAAVGFYWIISTVIGFLQTILLQKFYSVGQMGAKQEAQRVALLEEQEALVQYEYNPKFEKTVQKNNKKGKKKK